MFFGQREHFDWINFWIQIHFSYMHKVDKYLTDRKTFSGIHLFSRPNGYLRLENVVHQRAYL